MIHPLLKVDETKIIQQLDVNKLIAQIALGVIVALSVRKIVAEIDAWKAKRKSV